MTYEVARESGSYDRNKRDEARNLLREIRTDCYEYVHAEFMGSPKTEVVASLNRIRTRFQELTAGENLARWDDSLQSAGRPRLFQQLIPAIAYFIAVSTSRTEVEAYGRIVDAICDTILEKCKIPKYGNYSKDLGRLNFTAVTLIKQAYWSARSKWKPAAAVLADHRPDEHTTNRVIRVNDAPFAEAVHPDLMARYAHQQGYAIEVVGHVNWSDVAMALHTNRIDVAFYNGSIKSQFRALVKRFDPKLVFQTGPLFYYRRYPILKFSDEARGHKVGVPWRSDFEAVVLSHKKASDQKLRTKDKNFFELRTKDKYGRAYKQVKLLRDDGVVYVPSADLALERMVNGDFQFCITGGLQAQYALRQFSNRAQFWGYVDRATRSERTARDARLDDSAVCFWAAVERRQDAEALLYPLIEIWNNHVVGRWPAIVSGVGTEMTLLRDALVDLVNSYDHCAFLRDFDELKALIALHDEKREDVKLEIHRVKI
jgi:hypothetical protein